MTRRSRKASLEGIRKAKAALIRNSLTHLDLAAQLNISRQPVSKFFQGKAVDRYIFVTICEKLNLDWDEIVTSSSLLDTDDVASISQIESLVQTVREKIHNSIHRRCGTMRVLDIEQPIRLDSIYTSVNILERVTGRRRVDIAELYQDYDLENLERFGWSSSQEKQVSGLEAVERYDKLMILGKPGSGKTMFLKWLAIQCNLGQFRASHVPVFITLKDFAHTREQPSLLDYITEQFSECGVKEPQAVETLLNQGRIMILLDGLDEVTCPDFNRVLQEIHKVSTQFYTSPFAIACRIAAWEYTFEQFTEVEVAAFDRQQIANFSAKWFEVKDPNKAERFVQKLQDNEPLEELATNPLLLTLLCLVFEESGFPANRSELYQEALDLLLKKWDALRNINRGSVYKQLSRQRKEDLLSQIAWTTFERGEYFFKQKAVEQQISDYIRNLPDANTTLKLMQ